MALTKLDKASIIAIRDCMGVKKRESILIVSDNIKREIGLNLYQNALRLGYKAIYVEMEERKVNGEEPPKEIAELMKMFPVVMCPTAKSLTHTDARRAASALGSRIATFPGITKEIMIRGLNADYNKIAALTIKLSKLMDKTKIVRITSDAGTDIEMDISGRVTIPSKGLYHKKGESGNLPTGEAFAAPLEGTTNGVFVVDGSMAGIGKMEGESIKIKVEKGYATEITGGKSARKLIKMLEPFGKKGRNIAEIGIGTNDKVKLSGLILEDEKVLGTAHIALGNNLSMGGKVSVGIHIDGVIKKPDIWFDNKQIMKKGKLLV